jgi:hypothetical protein
MRISLKTPLILLGISIFFANLPLLMALVAGTIAEMNQCVLQQGHVNPCIVIGTDLGEWLYLMGMSGWLLMATIPLGFTGAVVSVIWLLIVLWKNRER